MDSIFMKALLQTENCLATQLDRAKKWGLGEEKDLVMSKSPSGLVSLRIQQRLNTSS